MNYIRHLNAFFSFVRSDNRLTSSHVSLYLALFQYWNFNRFQNPFSIYRDNIMQLSKIGSKNTYHKCIKELHEAKYIFYHPSSSKFQVVRISIVKLDTQQETTTRYKQLDLFTQNQQNASTDFDTDTVPNLGRISTDFDTVPVPKMGHIIKQTVNKQNSVCNTPTKNFNEIEKIQDKKNGPAGVPNLGHRPPAGPKDSGLIRSGCAGGVQNHPTLSVVEEFFRQNNYSIDEANKFFHYNNGKNWMLTEKLPIKNWKSIAHKWMLNAKGSVAPFSPPGRGVGGEVQFLYELFLEGKQISKQIQPEYFDHLQLQLTEEIKQQAWQRRINQLAGSNESSITILWQAYITNNPDDPLIKKDEPHLLSLAKRIAVLNHFQQSKDSGKTKIGGRESN